MDVPGADVSLPRRGHELLTMVPENFPVWLLKESVRLTKLPMVLHEMPVVPQLIADVHAALAELC